jgi:hypothetical protein
VKEKLLTRIGWWRKTWNHRWRRKGGLLNVRKIVFRLFHVSVEFMIHGWELSTHILVQSKLAKWPQWIVSLRPHFRHVEDIPSIRLSVLGIHYLDIRSPSWIVLSLNGIKEVTDVMIRIFSSQLFSLRACKSFDSKVCLEMDFDVFECSILLKLDMAPQHIKLVAEYRRTKDLPVSWICTCDRCRHLCGGPRQEFPDHWKVAWVRVFLPGYCCENYSILSIERSISRQILSSLPKLLNSSAWF